MFGLAQLYQIRGRVGRSNRRAYAYLIIPSKLHEEARKRLETLTEYESLGSGYQIAMRDMELRGAGSLLGTKQSGIINAIGFNYYNRLLEQAIKNLQEEKPQILWEEKAREQFFHLKIDMDYYFPDDYISNEKERLEIYRKLLKFRKASDFTILENELVDRFGEIPVKAKNTLIYYKLRILAKIANVQSTEITNENIILEFNNKNLPKRKKLKELINHFECPISFNTTRNLEISFKISEVNNVDESEQIEKCLKILDFFIKN